MSHPQVVMRRKISNQAAQSGWSQPTSPTAHGLHNDSPLNRIGWEFMECHVCASRYRKPKLLDCLHSVCEDCLVRNTPSSDKEVTCPECQQTTAIPTGGIRNLTSNKFMSALVQESIIQVSVSLVSLWVPSSFRDHRSPLFHSSSTVLCQSSDDQCRLFRVLFLWGNVQFTEALGKTLWSFSASASFPSIHPVNNRQLFLYFFPNETEFVLDVWSSASFSACLCSLQNLSWHKRNRLSLTFINRGPVFDIQVGSLYPYLNIVDVSVQKWYDNAMPLLLMR